MTKHNLAVKMAKLSIQHPWLMLVLPGIITVISLILASGLEMRMNWSDTLPANDPVVKAYREVQERFGNAGGIVVALEGDYDRITALADTLEPLLRGLESMYSVQGRIPSEFIRQNGFKLLKPEEFKRILKSTADPGLLGTLRGMNDDYETEYTDSESNLRRDEVNIARSMFGLYRAFEILVDNLESNPDAATIEDAVDAFSLGEPWMLSLDRRMLLIICDPVASQLDVEEILDSAVDTENLLAKIKPLFPDVEIGVTGFARVGLDEMNSIGIYTILLSIASLLLIYLLLARSFRSWVLPVIALLPLLIGIFWTMGLLYICFGGLNIFTSMIMIVLIGLGIDFSIHMISRYNEEIASGKCQLDAMVVMLEDTGIAVITGGLTTAAAFLTLLIGDTQGVYEFGVAAGGGVILTLVAIFLVLPSMLVIRESFLKADAIIPRGELLILGKIATSGWRHPLLYLGVTLCILIFSIWAKQHIDFEYDFLNLEPKGLKSIALQREIPKRFGMSDHAAWVVANTVEECRDLKEKFRKQPLVGDVASISDYLPSNERLSEYSPMLIEFGQQLNFAYNNNPDSINQAELLVEINRLWDNLDLMSNLAYTGGLDRIVKVVDGLTGTQTETGEVNKDAILPRLVQVLQSDLSTKTLADIAGHWRNHMYNNIYSMANPDPISIKDLPETIQKTHLPRIGEGFLVHIIPRKALWGKPDLDAFAAQTLSVSQKVCGTEQLVLVMFSSILSDGKKAALFALLVITLIVLVHFRGPFGLLALIPLASGTLFMIGLMYLIGEKYNYLNLIAVPIILGIGIDDGIHALHRFRHERGIPEERVRRSFSFVGRAILLTSLTTMIGFGSIAFYTMEGMASFGRALFMGVGACFVATVLVLPAVLRLVTRETKT